MPQSGQQCSGLRATTADLVIRMVAKVRREMVPDSISPLELFVLYYEKSDAATKQRILQMIQAIKQAIAESKTS